MQENTTPSLVRKLAEVMKEVDRIPKNGHNSHFNYDFVRESDMVDAIRDKLAQRHVTITPSRRRIEVHELSKPNKSGEVVSMKVGVLHVTYTFRDGESGEAFDVESMGEIEQDGGKGIYKASTGAKKYMLLEAFLIATGDDPENGTASKPGRSAATPAASTSSQGPSAPARPKAPTGPKACSSAQMSLIKKLADQHNLDLEAHVFPAYGVAKGKQPTGPQASVIIDGLKNNPPSPQPSEQAIAEAERAGMRNS